jgi:transposase
MHVDKCTSTQNGKTYSSVLLRHTYRDENGKVKHKTLLNLSNCPSDEIFAIEWALKHKKELPGIITNSIKRKTGKSFAAVYMIEEIIKRLFIDKTLGMTIEGKLAQFQVISRTINQGSCLSSIRLASEHQAICEILSIEESITEDDLYKNLSWLTRNQSAIELKLFKKHYQGKEPEIFLYDVTSSYFEGTHNSLGNFGYNRDKKPGKMQLVAGLLCDETGHPLAIRLFKGNTLDINTVHDQIKQVSQEFGSKRVTFVGDRGMIKSKQIAELESEDFYYITAITKPQIETLLQNKIIRMGLFDSDVKEVEYDGVRYILRRNPLRAEEISRNRYQKESKIEKLCQKKNEYLKEHRRAKSETAIKEITRAIKKLKIDSWLIVELLEEEGRELILKENQERFADESQLDGCYVIKSNLPEEVSKECIHDRYKDLKNVESGFRSMKTDWLEIRPWYVRTEASTRGHAFIVMLSYMIIRYLRERWKSLNITVEEGLKILNGLSLLEVKINKKIIYYEVPEPSEIMEKLLNLAGVKLPDIMPYKQANVYSRKKLQRKA